MNEVGDSVPKRVVIGAQAIQQSESPMQNCTDESIFAARQRRVQCIM
ncbi:hypothetical protein [Noviherbaspirillum saxi]|nr:hypothetical protein [Noviherbaspirillum saxi]